MSGPMDEFLEDFDDATTNVIYARHEDFPRLVRLWFKVLEDSQSSVSGRVVYLEKFFNWERVRSEVLRPQSGIGNGALAWPDEMENRLSAYLALFRRFVVSDPAGYQFAFDYFSTGTNSINDTLQNMTRTLFDQAARELRKYLVRNLNQPIPGNQTIPASDRLVTLDHNSATYEHTIRDLDALEAQLRTNNSIEVDPDGRERLAAEIGAGRRLLQSRTIRVMAVAAVLVPALKWLAEMVAGTAIGLAAEALIQQLLALIPGII